MTDSLSVGISTCPNDTYLFHGLLTGAVETEGLALSFELADIEELNTGLSQGRFDVAKVSAHAACELADRVRVLPVGWAVGRGVGPIVLASEARARDAATPPLVLSPGLLTTAHLLWRVFHPEPVRMEHVVFSEIVPRLQAGSADLGICIHEGRFTWEGTGLALVEDLGETWEEAMGAPLPLGGLVARDEVDAERLAAFTRATRGSLEHARSNGPAALSTMRRWAQEASDDVLWRHVELYVTQDTRELSPEGRRALTLLFEHLPVASGRAGNGLRFLDG